MFDFLEKVISSFSSMSAVAKEKLINCL